MASRLLERCCLIYMGKVIFMTAPYFKISTIQLCSRCLWTFFCILGNRKYAVKCVDKEILNQQDQEEILAELFSDEHWWTPCWRNRKVSFMTPKSLINAKKWVEYYVREKQINWNYYNIKLSNSFFLNLKIEIVMIFFFTIDN